MRPCFGAKVVYSYPFAIDAVLFSVTLNVLDEVLGGSQGPPWPWLSDRSMAGKVRYC